MSIPIGIFILKPVHRKPIQPYTSSNLFNTMRFLHFLSTALLLACSHLASAQGTIVSYSLFDSYSVSDIETIITDFGAPVFLLQPRFDVDVYRVVYETPNAQGTGTTIASGAIAVPAGIQCPLPLLAYQHGTTSNRYDVPSYGSAEMRLGVIFAACDGYVVTMADYLGLGDSPGFHPYVHARSEASAGLDLLRAARTLQDSLSYNVNEQLFIFGYSQGGHGAMALFKDIQENHAAEFQVTGAAPMSGPYDVSGVQAQTITDTAAYSSPGYLPYVVMGYQEAYGNLYNNLSEVFKSPYDTLLPSLFDGTNGFGYINNQLPDTPNQMIQPLMFQDFLNNPNNAMRLALQDNDVYDWTPQSPLRMLYCTQDEQVFYGNALVAFDQMVTNGAQTVEAINMGAFDHGGCLQGCMLNGRAFFAGFADWLGGMNIETTVTPLSAPLATDGSAVVVVTGGQAPYSYLWNTGDTTAQVNNLDFGTYTVHITDARGCFHTDVFVMDTDGSTGVENVAETANWLRLAPNPAQTQVRLEMPAEVVGVGALFIRDMLGRLIYSLPTVHSEMILLDVYGFPAGLYNVELVYQGQSFSQKLVVE